jgi:predicted SprT family Zn-dependent metalloprotease
MARLRKPSPNEPIIFMAPGTRATRSSPRKTTRSTQYTESSDEEDVILVPKQSRRELRDTNASSQDAEDSFLAPKSIMGSDALTPRKQRILRPVESNSRLLKKLSNESLASPEKKRRERRVRSGTTDIDVGKKTSLLYAKTLARSVVKKQASKAQLGAVEEPVFKKPARQPSAEDPPEEMLEAEEEVEAETSLWCGDEDDVSEEKEAAPVAEPSDDEDDDSIVDTRRRRQRPQQRPTETESDEESEVSLPEAKSRKPFITQPPQQEVSAEEPQSLTSIRPPHRKGHSTISNWAQEVIDLTSSPDAPSSFVAPPLPPPTRMRTSSFASSRPQTSSSHGGFAVLSYSPTPTKNRSPCKAPPLSRPVTPPLAPPSPSKLVSPSKKKPTIPKAPDLHPSLNAFWNPEVVNDWNEKHSPSKPLVSPRKQKWREDIVKMMEGIALSDDGSDTEDTPPSPTTSPRKKTTAPRSPMKKPVLTPGTSDPSVKEVRAQRKAFSEQKHAIAESFLAELDTTISQGQISQLSKQTGGIKLIWSRTLKTTAGRANWRREQIRIRTGPLPTDYTTEIRHHCSIELAEKVIDDSERLYNVLAHEYCHLTTFMISNVRNNPHGAEFKSWGRKVSQAFASKGVEVTTKHSYAIEFKYVWECIECSYEFKRHSKSIDTSRHSCGKCKGRLVQTKPTPRQGGKVDGEGKKGKSEYQVFVKENFARIKKDMLERGEYAKMGKVMENVAKEYREMKAQKESGKELDKALEGLKI